MKLRLRLLLVTLSLLSLVTTFQEISRTCQLLRPCKGKERMVEILQDAGISLEQIQNEHCPVLPYWKEVTELYGPDPIVIGMETCERYRRLLSNNNVTEPKIRVAGLYNSGTNGLQSALNNNIKDLGGRKKYPVPWGKHKNAKLIDNIPKNFVLPLVLVRDPFRWVQSMCKKDKHYDVKWKRTKHCPNLLERDANGTVINNTTVEVNVADSREVYDSLVHYWSEWNRAYLDANYPRLMIRFEDILFHQPQVMEQVRTCAGLSTLRKKQHYIYLLEDAKGRSSTFLEAMTKYGSSRGRLDPFLIEDLQFAKSHLDMDLMRLFHYRI